MCYATIFIEINYIFDKNTNICFVVANELVDDVVEEQLDLEEIRLTKTQNESLCTEPQLGEESHSTTLVGLSSFDDATLTQHALENFQNCDAFEMNTFQGL